MSSNLSKKYFGGILKLCNKYKVLNQDIYFVSKTKQKNFLKRRFWAKKIKEKKD